uniref:HECT domain-containing protein n=2 Tax=Clytia hemisphaerica TaxID=252671 RepID=A0A7M5X552_9CNID
IVNLVNQITEGMKFYDALPIIKSNKEIFRPVFTNSTLFEWTYETVYPMLVPDYRGEIGSNKRKMEIDTYKVFLVFLETAFKDESSKIKPTQIMATVTGCETVPPLGLPLKITIDFATDCKPSPDGKPCDCLPVFSTCALSILIPTHTKTLEKMEESFDKAFSMGKGFLRT